MSLKRIERFSNEELRAELQRRVEAVTEPQPSNGIDSFSELEAGTWGSEATVSSEGKELAADWQEIARLALTRIREMLAIPLDTADPNYGASLRGINSAVSTGLAFISKINEEMLRPPKHDILPELLERMRVVEQEMWSRQYPELVQKLIQLDDERIDQLLAMRREHSKQYEQRGLPTNNILKDIRNREG
jgi:hypothetical protein